MPGKRTRIPLGQAFSAEELALTRRGLVPQEMQGQFPEISLETALWADPVETRHAADGSEETTSLFENGESFGHEGPLEDRPEEADDDELTNHVRQYMRQLRKTPLLTGEGEKEIALRIEEARRELEEIGLSLPHAVQVMRNVVHS